MTTHMRCAISLLLIPMCLFGQSLPHSHGGSRMGEPADRAARPHVHLHASHHHHHHGDGVEHDHHHAKVEKHSSHHRGAKKQLKTPAFMAQADHDEDAFYVEVTVPSITRQVPVKATAVGRLVDSIISHQVVSVTSPLASGHSGAAPPGYCADLPILARTFSLRI